MSTLISFKTKADIVDAVDEQRLGVD